MNGSTHHHSVMTHASSELVGALAAAAWLDPVAAADVLARARREFGGGADPALEALAALADQIVGRWRYRLEELHTAWATVVATEADVAELHRMAAAMLRALQELAAKRPSPGSGGPMPLGGSDDAAGADTDARQPDRVAGDGHRQSIEVRLFGTFQVSCDGQLVESWQGQKCARLVRYLFAQAPRQIGREALAELFWPDADTEVARRGLHQAIYKIRRSLRHAGCTGTGILYLNETYGIDPSLDHVSDIGEFERLADVARDAERQGVERAAFDALQAAVAWYRGDLLEDSPHEEWTLYERDRLRLRYVEIANRLAEILLGQGEHEGALAVSQRLLTHELADESAHRRVIRCFVHQGQRSLAIRQYQICTEALDRTFGVVPAPETTRLYEDLIASEDR